MPEFQYKAKNLDNKLVKGSIEANSEESLARLLRTKQLFLMSCKVVESNSKDKRMYRLKATELSDFSRQIANMVSSGITIVRAVSIMKDRDMKSKLKAVYEKIYASLQEGNVLSVAMQSCRGSFPILIINMFAAGEASGNLDKTALKMAVYYENEARLNGKIKSAMAYPIILLVLTIAVVLLIFTFVLPSFFDLFDGIELPLVTRIVIATSNFVTTYWYYLIAASIILSMLTAYAVRLPKVSFQIDKFKLKIPKIKSLLKTIYTARFARTLSSLYTSGLSMINAVEISSSIIGNRYVSSQFSDVIEMIRNGEFLSTSIEKIDSFDGKLKTVMYIGEESGRLDEMLISMSETLEYESEMATSRLITYIEPIMIVGMAGIIGVIMLSVILPIMSLYQGIG